MRRLLFIIIGLFRLAACKTDKTSVLLDFECFNQPHLYIKYKQPINGYTVKVMWLQNGEVGNALFLSLIHICISDLLQLTWEMLLNKDARFTIT